jgi:hypothetical protein
MLLKQAIERAATQASSTVNMSSFYQLMLGAAVCEHVLALIETSCSSPQVLRTRAMLENC